MSSSNQLPPHLAEVPTFAFRRTRMKAFFRHHGRYNDEMMATSREKAEEILCLAIYNKGKASISEAYFEYAVDHTIWYNWAEFNDLGPHATPLPEWPWPKAKPAPFDMTEGYSRTYALWLRTHAPTVEPSDEKAAEKALENPAAGSSEQPPVAAEPEPEPETIVAEPELEPVAAEPELESEAIATEPESEPEQESDAAEDKPVPEPQVASAPASAPTSYEVVFRPKTEAKRTLAPAQGLSSSRWAPPPAPLVALDALPPKTSPPVPRGSMVRPPVPSLAAREHVWKAKYGDGFRHEPVCGPFEVRIPCWIEFEELIWGHNGQTFAKVQGLIHRDLAISWEEEKPTSLKGGQDVSLSVDYEGRPCKLIVGFSKGVDHTNGPNQSLLLSLWNSILGWAGLSHVGTSMTLAEYLRVNQARQDAVVISTTSGPRNPVRALYEQGQENALVAQQAAKKEKSAMDQWQSEVHQILQSPIEVATERLNAWVVAGDRDMDLRITVAERVWVTSVSGPVKMAQGSYWANCLRAGLRVVGED